MKCLHFITLAGPVLIHSGSTARAADAAGGGFLDAGLTHLLKAQSDQ